MKRFDLNKIMDNLPIISYDGFDFKARVIQKGEAIKLNSESMQPQVDNSEIKQFHVGLYLTDLLKQNVEQYQAREQRMAEIFADLLKARLVKGNPDKITAEWVMNLPGEVDIALTNAIQKGILPKDEQGTES